MNIPCEMFLTIQLHLTCRKDHVKSPTRKEGPNLFRITSDVSSRNNPRMKNNMMNAVTSLMQNLPAMKKQPRRKGRPVQEE